MWLNRLQALLPDAPSIRNRLLWQLGLVFACGMLALYLAATSYARFAADSSYDRVLLGSAGSIAETLSVTPTGIRVDIPYVALDMLAAAPDDRVFYRVIGTDGGTVTGYADLPRDRSTTPQSEDSGAIRFFDAQYRGEMVRFAMLGREVRVGGHSGWVWVQVGQTREARRLLARDLTVRALLPILALTLVAVAVVWFSVGSAVRPLETIGRSLMERRSSDLSPISTAVPKEIAPLVLAVNQFMVRLDNSMGILRTFIANAAHQLRTPLTTVIVQLRSAERGSGKDRREGLAAAGESAARLARLVDQLLSDAMITHRIEEVRTAPFDLKKIVEQSLRDTLPISSDADVRFTTELAEAPMTGDEVMVAEAIKNLVHNALIHGPGGREGECKIELTLNRLDDGFALTVADDGPGIGGDLLPGIGERFRTGPGNDGGAGLGLSIVRQVVESHRGLLRFGNPPGGGFEARMWLPAS